MTKRYQNTAQFIEQEAPIESFYCLSKGALAKQVQRFMIWFPGVVAYAAKASPASLVGSTVNQYTICCTVTTIHGALNLIRD